LDTADAALDLRCNHGLAVGRQLDCTVSHGDRAAKLLIRLLLMRAVDPGFMFIAQKGCQQGIAHEHNLIAGKNPVQDLHEIAFDQPQLHVTALILTRHPLHEQVVAGAAADDRIDGAGDSFLSDLDRDLCSPRHSGSQPAAGVLYGNDHTLGASSRVHLQPQMVDLTAELLAWQCRKARDDLLAASQEANIGFQHVADDPQNRWINDVVEMVRGADDLPGADVGMRDHATDWTGDRSVWQAPGGSLHVPYRSFVKSDHRQLLARYFKGSRSLGKSSLCLGEGFASNYALVVQGPALLD
jgi:hypothetical protein